MAGSDDERDQRTELASTPRVDVGPVADDDLPVVARLVVEIRSDGRRTVARGAIEDAATGERMTIEARGATPLSLALSLAKSMLTLPALGRSAARALLRGRKR